MTLNKLVKLTMFWTTGPWCVNNKINDQSAQQWIIWHDKIFEILETENDHKPKYTCLVFHTLKYS